MEDFAIIIEDASSEFRLREKLKHHYVFAIFDGHGGDAAAKYCQSNLLATLCTHEKYNTGDPFSYIRRFPIHRFLI